VLVLRPRSSLVAALATAVALVVPAAATAASSTPSWAPEVPWGAGCEPAPSPAQRTAANCGATLVEGEAIAPPDAPPVVRQVIAAANEIDTTPYIWGGGHASFTAKGYDCSGAVSYALHGAGLLDYTQVSGQLAHYGDFGPGRWITIYANAGHAYMTIAGRRFDTSAQWIDGSRWTHLSRSSAGYVVRHPLGL
jgi:cell wall-associated NlpC family hydrolase